MCDFVDTTRVFFEMKRSPENEQKKNLTGTIKYKNIPFGCGSPDFLTFWGLGEYSGEVALHRDFVLTTFFGRLLSGSVRTPQLIAERGKRCA